MLRFVARPRYSTWSICRAPQVLRRAVPSSPRALHGSSARWSEESSSSSSSPAQDEPDSDLLQLQDGTVLDALQRAESAPPTDDSNTEPELSQQVRQAMRKMTHPVVVVHAQADGAERPSGMLVSSFNTITLRPEPYISFNVKTPSETRDAIAASGTFTVSPVTDEKVAHHFSGFWRQRYPWRNHERPADEFGRFLSRSRPFALECEWVEDKSITLGDHVVMIGRVKKFITDIGPKSTFVPLCYQNGEYRLPGGVARIKREHLLQQRLRRANLEKLAEKSI